ncbi:MAG TPA: hypothetical protein VJP02_21860 [Candidatus Sulfotelmatobacter sp.]|nr:hypothetical protein [Candidatus Sulfotelmatobacter sp.]
MRDSRFAILLVALVFSHSGCGDASGQKVDYRPAVVKRKVALNFANNGQHLSANVGQQIEITLGTVGPKQYGTPQVSSRAVRFESVALAMPINPGGPTYVYIFEAIAKGEAEIEVPIINSENPDATKLLSFAVTIRVGSAPGNRSALCTSMRPDQVNTALWKNGWTNLLNDVRQTFTPSLPVLTAVEAELVVGNPGPSDDEITMYLRDGGGGVLAVVSRIVTVTDCSHVRFFFPNGGLAVSPGQVYSIGLGGGSLFGWKYVAGGYSKGAASFNGKPLLPDARSTFLFRTFGTN